MFGYVLVNKPELKIKDFDLYRSYYCGICHALKENYGFTGRMTLNYDMTFLAMLLSDLYDKEDCDFETRCVAHMARKHNEKRNEFSRYCADMCVFLSYFKGVDDWNDDHGPRGFIEKNTLWRKAERVREVYPEKCASIEKHLEALSEVEKTPDQPIDKCANAFGEIMGEVFCYQDDIFREDLYNVGFFLGKFIYVLDAYEDVEKDLEKGSFNPFREDYEQTLKTGDYDKFDQKVMNILMLMIGECTDAFEKLPLIENVEVLRNILYSGVWVRFKNCQQKRQEERQKEGEKGENGSL